MKLGAYRNSVIVIDIVHSSTCRQKIIMTSNSFSE